MIDPKTTLLSQVLDRIAKALASAAAPADAVLWAEARQVIAATGEENADLSAAVEARDAAALGAIVEAWRSGGAASLPEQDKAVCKRAMKAYRKRLKLTRLDAESSLGGGPMSSGRSSGIVAITPPNQYPPEVWEELERQGRLLDAGHGMYELPSE